MTYEDSESSDCDDECDDEGECEEEEDETWKGQDLSEAFEAFEEYLKAKGFKYLSEGSFRRVYERGDIVIKIPTYSDGLMDNRVEHAAYHRYWNGPTPDGIYLAPCRLLANGCLMMRKLTWGCGYSFPEWVKLIDGRQVGPYKGRVVAYDYALDITDRFQWEREWKCESRFFNSVSWRSQRSHIDSFLTELEKQNAPSVGDADSQ